MLTMILAGCDDNAIAEEYALNDLDSKRTWGIAATRRLMAQPGLRGNVDAVENVVRAHNSYMMATLQVQTRVWDCRGLFQEHFRIR